jgi:multiple sugar transport system substrate-binding protein
MPITRTLTRTLTAVAASAALLLGGQAAAQETVLFAGWSGEEQASKPIIEWMISSFNEANPDAQVTWLGWPWGQTQQQLVLRHRSGQAPDVAQLDMSWLQTFAVMDALVDLNEVFGREFLEERIDPGLLALGEVDGRQLAIPWTTASIGMLANEEVLRQAGVESLPTTVEEFEAALEAIRANVPGVVPYGFSTKGNSMISADFQAWLWTFGGEIFDADGNVVVDSPATVATLEWLSDLMDRGLLARDVDRFDARTIYARHGVGFYDDAIMARSIARSNSGDEDFDEHVVALPRPVVEVGADPRSVAWGHHLVLFKQADAVTADDAAARFLHHLVFDDEVPLAYFEDQGLLPVTRSALAAEVVREDEYATGWAAFTATSRRNETVHWPNAAQMTDVIGEEVQAVLLGQKEPARAAADMARRLGALADEVR